MKKLVITAIVAVACFGVSQGQGLVSSLNTNTAGGVWVQSSNGVTLHLNDIITISPGTNVTGNFITPTDLSAPKNIGGATFSIQSNRVFDVTVKAASTSFTATNFDIGAFGNVPGDNTNMPASVLSMALTANNTLGGNPGYPIGTYLPIPTTSNYSLGNGAGPGSGYGNLLILDGLPGGNNTVLPNTTRTFTVGYQANPGWAYAGGDYSMNVVFTAAQE
jgi:hypothetical protein